VASGSGEASGTGPILVGFDGSDGGRDALELARTLASVDGRPVTVVAVLPFGPLPVGYALLGEEADEETAPLFAAAREALAPLEPETRAYGGGSPAAVINDLAEREGFGTIVVGSPHRGAVGRVLIGSVAEGLLHGAPCEVAVAPRGYAADRHACFGKVAVAYDGGPEARAALARAEALARVGNARLELLTAWAPPVPVPGAVGYVPPPPPDPEQLLREAAAAVDESLGVETRCLSGSPGPAIAEACAADNVGLLVAGSRGYGPLARVLMGSVSRSLARKAPCPVLVVPRP